MSRRLRWRLLIQIELQVAWRRFKEWLHRPVCWWQGHHEPTMLEDDETIYCERCGKVLKNIREILPMRPNERCVIVTKHETSGVERRSASPTVKPYATHRTSEWLQIEHIKAKELSKEELAQHHWLPEPKTHRKTTTRTHQPPAERHRGAISRIMSKRGGRTSSRYRKTIRESASIPIEEEEND